MNRLTSPRDDERFRAAIGRQIGLRFEDAKLRFLGEVLCRRLNDLDRDSDSYLWELEYDPSHAELMALARELTVGETYFFRNNEQFRALAEVVVPDRIRAQGKSKVLRFLSAGCSSGEEAYSMAIVMRETIADPSWKVSIRAVDLNPAALEKAARARYSGWALRETPIEIRSRWFREDGRDVVLDSSILSMVTIEQANLASANAELWQPASYDVIFCRNVLMYFEPEQMRGAIERIAQSLAPGGYLFLGHAETMRGVSERFRLHNTNETFYYQLADGAEPDGQRIVQFVPKQPAPRRPLPRQNFAWFDAISLASERVAALLPLPVTFCDPIPEPAAAPFDPAPAMELLRQERFTEALHHVRTGSKENCCTPDMLLLEAALLIHSGQLDAADQTASRLLAIDGRSAGAYYVLALCREHARLHERAARHHRAAIRCDPLFAMPRLHLGLLARRAGDRDGARRAFAQALVLLEGEDTSRLQLFGGGFSREALVALCESALRACGEPA